MRRFLAGAMVVGGLIIMAGSYLYLAAPWGFPPSAEFFSNPVVPFAPGIFVIGVLILFLSAVVYELVPGD